MKTIKKINKQSKQYKKIEKQVNAYNECYWNLVKPDTQKYDAGKIIIKNNPKEIKDLQYVKNKNVNFVLDTSEDSHEEGFRNAQKFIKQAIKSGDICSQTMKLKSVRKKNE